MPLLRRILDGMVYTLTEQDAGLIELVQIRANPEPEVEGCEPWLREGHRDDS